MKTIYLSIVLLLSILGFSAGVGAASPVVASFFFATAAIAFGLTFRWGLPPVFLLLLCSIAFGGHGSCYYPTQSYQREVVYRDPQQTTNIYANEAFFAAPDYAQRYAVTPTSIQLAKLGQMKRANQLEQDRIQEYESTLQQPQQAPMPIYYVPVQAAPYCPPGQQPTIPPQQPADPNIFSSSVAPKSMVEATCYACHSGPEAKGHLDLSQPITCKQLKDAIGKVAAGEMPKPSPKNPKPSFSPAQFVQLMKEIASLKTASAGGSEAE